MRMIDLSKLSPAPWTGDENATEIRDGNGESVLAQTGRERDCFGEEDFAFVLLARQAFDVMMRRGWEAQQYQRQWFAVDGDRMDGRAIVPDSFHPDPFTALVEADRWTKEREGLCAPRAPTPASAAAPPP
jgi:hypothetical protein